MKLGKLALTATLALAAGMASAQEKTKIVYASYLNPLHITNPALTTFFENIGKDSNGTIEYEMHVGGSLLSGRDIPGGVRDGVADAGYFVGAYIPSEMAVDTYLSEFSLWNDDPMVMTGVLNELILFNCPDCTEEYRKFNTRPLATYALTPYVYHCREELKTLDDFKGKRVRGIASYGELARALGATPINVSPDEAYEALDRGILDCALHSIAAQKARSYGEAAKYVILDPLGGFIGASTMNLRIDKWNALTPDQRKAMTSNLAELATSAVFNYIAEDINVIEEYTKTGSKFYHADPEFAEFIADFARDYEAKAIESGRAKGVAHPEQIAQEIKSLREKWTKLLEDNGRDRETFQRLLDEEIFSKINVTDQY